MARAKSAKKPPVIGQPIPRVEDQRLLTGRGKYLDDLNLPGQAYAYIVRSPHAHARIRGIEARVARACPGVLGVFTAADMDKDSVKPLPPMTRDPRYEFRNRDGSRMPEPAHWALAKDKVRYAGDCVALVVAETAEQAAEAGGSVEVDYEILGAVPSAATALAKGAPRVWDELPDNTCFEWEVGDKHTTAEAFNRAAHVTRLELANERLVVAFMEPRAALASYDETNRSFTLHASCQGAHRFRETLAFTLGVPQESVRVIVGDVGGGFGPRGYFYPENLIVAWAARHLRRPVKWRGDRGESFLTDVQARGHTLRCALALDKDGRFTGLKVSSDWNLGAYIAARGIMATIAHMGPIITGAYRFGAAHFELRGVFTNTAIAYAYRGIGRAEASHALERLVDEAARETGRDRIALRRLNMVPASAMPYATQGGAVYDSGEFEKNMDIALEESDWKGFSVRKVQSEKRGRLRGIGLCNFVENAGGAPSEFAEVKVDPAGRVTLYGGSGPSGQGHETAFAQVLAAELGLPFEDVTVVIGDTAQVRAGYGSAASRSMRKAGTATVLSARAMVEKGRALAGDMLEAAARDIEYEAGRFRVAGTDRSVGLYEVAAHAVSRGDELSAHGDHKQPEETYPNGCQVAEVEIDPATGHVALLRHTLVNDVGRVINPLILGGQLHGGIAQGIGQALIEQCAYDRATGQLLSGTFMDYAIPRADEMPFFGIAINEVPCANNPLGVKGAGEGGTTGAPPAVVNAIVDALASYGVRDIDMPATPERVWRAMRHPAREQNKTDRT